MGTGQQKTMVVPVFKGEGRLEYEERPVPRITQPDDVLVRIEACGICGTDLNILAVPPQHKATPHIVIGHEGVGIVEQTGAAVNALHQGERVVIAPRITCGECPYCQLGFDNQCTNYRSIGTNMDGAFAPYIIAPQRALFKIDRAVPRDDAALFEPLSCVVGAVARASVQAGDVVAIIGAGPMGLLFALMYRISGAGTIIMADIVDSRLEFAQKLGVDVTINPSRNDLLQSVLDLTGIGADLVVDAVGNQMGTALSLARRAGQVLLFGLRPNAKTPIDQYMITRYDLTVHGTFVGLKPFKQTIRILENRQLRPSVLVTHHLPLSELYRGLELMRTGQGIKVLIEP